MDELRMKYLNAQLEKQPKSEWPKIWWSLYDGIWLDELGVQEELAEDSNYVIQRIVDRIGLKACMRYLNTEFNGMTDQMFDDMWDSAHDTKNALCNKRSGNTEDCAKNCADNRHNPIMAALRSLFFSFAGSFLALAIFQLLKLL